MGYAALGNNTTGNENTSLGYNALGSATTAAGNTAVGWGSLDSTTTGYANVAVGLSAMDANTTGYGNAAVGYQALDANTTGADNTAVGMGALSGNTTADNNTGIGHDALQGTTTGTQSVGVGHSAGKAMTTASQGTFIGTFSGEAATGGSNTYVGAGSGQSMTSGAKNTLIGRYNGNQNGLDIRTSSSNITLSDGDGYVRLYINSSGQHFITNDSNFTDANNAIVCVNHGSGVRGINVHTPGTGGSDRVTFQNDNGTVGTINTSGSSTSYATSSDYRMKENVEYTWDATTRLKQVKPARFNFIADDTNTLVDGFIAHEVSSIVPEAVVGQKDAVDDDGNPVMQGLDQSKLVPLLVKTIQELEARITALESA